MESFTMSVLADTCKKNIIYIYIYILVCDPMFQNYLAGFVLLVGRCFSF